MAVNPQQMGLAQAIATMGSAGIQQQQQQQAAAAAPKQQTLNDVAARAGLVDAPDAFLKQAAAQAAQPFDNAAKSASANNAALNAYTGSLQAANGNYLSELHAAEPLAQGELNKAAQGANFSQLMQLLNLKNSMEDRAYNHQLQDSKLADVQTQKTQQATAQTAMNSLVNLPDGLARQTATTLLQAGDLPTALKTLDDKDLQKKFKDQGVDAGELRKLALQYYSPATYQALDDAGAYAPTPTVAKPQGSSNPIAALMHWNDNLPSWAKLGTKV